VARSAIEADVGGKRTHDAIDTDHFLAPLAQRTHQRFAEVT
jgi:hypothetical protein